MSAWRSSGTRRGRCRRSSLTTPGGGRRGCRWMATSSSAAVLSGRLSRWSTSASSCALTATASGSATAARSSRATSAAMTAAAGSRRRDCGPSHRRRPGRIGRPGGGAARARRLRLALRTTKASRPKSFARDASGARQRIRHAAFPAHKTLEDFDFTAQSAAEKPLLLHLAQLAWIHVHANVCLIGPPGPGKTHLAIALAIKACQAGHGVAFATAQQWVTPDRRDQPRRLRRLAPTQIEHSSIPETGALFNSR
jgi:hypothetical protein